MLALITEIPRGVRKPVPEQPEMRNSPRFSLEARAWLRQQSDNARVEVLDISQDGARVMATAPMNPDEPVLMRYYLQNARRPLSVWGQVTRCEQRDDGTFELGLHFHGLAQRIREQLGHFLQRQAREISAELQSLKQQNQRSWFAQFGI